MKILDIDENTAVPLKLMHVVLVACLAAAVWITKISLSLDQAQASIEMIQKDRADKFKIMVSIDQRLARIEGAMHIAAPESDK